ncbi:MAG: hypothetical protein PHI35_03920 [Victivallaceae bacterium]|nr:hypothetical protein [Victivallaceae bacterium]
MPRFVRTAAMLSAFVAGAFCPWAATGTGVIRLLIIYMMFTVMLQVHFSDYSLRIVHLWILLANLAVGVGAWAIFTALGMPTLAAIAFFTGITPTATAAPVVTGMLGGRIDFVICSFVVTNIGVALLLPVLIPMTIGAPVGKIFLDVVKSLCIVLLIPAAAALPIRLFYRNAAKLAQKLSKTSFYVWVVTVFLIVANASAFFISPQAPRIDLIFEAAILSLAICAVNFSLGYWLGGRHFKHETSQSLGQKNTTLTIYLALVYANPAVSLGPIFYVLWHNLWNTWQLSRHHEKKRFADHRNH